VQGIAGGTSNFENADGVQGFGSGTFSGVAGWGGGNSGTGAVGFGGGPSGPGVRGIGAGGPNTVPSSAVGVHGQGGPQSAGVLGQAGSSPADGVQGFATGSFSGVAGWGGDSSGTGVVGFGGGPAGPGVRGIAAGGPNSLPSVPAGVFGQANATGGSAGVQGVGPVGVHGVAAAGDGNVAVFADAPGQIGIFAGGAQAGFFAGDVVVNGHLSATTVSAVTKSADGSHRLLYCLESPDSWFEDFGFGRLTDGRARIQLDPDFAATVDTSGYHVFITEYDDNSGLFVTNRSNTGFEVRAKTSVSGATFSYRVVAKRKDIAPTRFANATLPAASLEKVEARMPKRA
jgi:hypothetical protein